MVDMAQYSSSLTVHAPWPWSAVLMSMLGCTDMPGRRSPDVALSPSSTILTGMRCTTLVKLPVALSGGSSANSWPLAGARLSTWP